MAAESYDHLRVDISALKLPYSTTGRGEPGPDIPEVQDRPRHAQRLIADLDAVVARKLSLQDSELPEKASGMHVTASARTTAGISAGGTVIEVLSVKGEGRSQRVNLFIKTDDLDTARRRIARYGDYHPGPRKPFDFSLFESASRLSGTTLDDLWTDTIARCPSDDTMPAHWELWVRADSADRVRSFAGRYKLQCEAGQADFPSVSVIRAYALPTDLAAFIDATSAILELRACSSQTLQTLSLSGSVQRSLAAGLLRHISAPAVDAPRICVLDTGVMAQHPLLAPALDADDCLTLNDAWGTSGWDSHGTRVAGVALYRDLQTLISRPRDLQLTTRLESVTVLRPDQGPRSPQEPLGEIVAAVSLIEAAATHRRVFCLASSDCRGLNDGVPNKISGSVDQLAWGLNGPPRLFCVAAGNVLDDPFLVAGYSSRNEESGIGSPGQALNALTVGGCTFNDDHPHDGELLCPAGDLSVSTRTSTSWVKRRSTKPDVVFEAGNIGVPGDDSDTTCEALSELNVLTTFNNTRHPLGTIGETSAATGAVAGIAGRLMARYPEYWPETIRGLIVHSASWTEAMLARCEGATKDDRVDHLLSMFGWGVPDEDAASSSASDQLTLIIEGSLIPYKKDGSKNALNECAYHPLPWPIEALQSLGSTDVELRVTLSYFIQPDMRAPSARRFADYPSHRLAFDLKGSEDDHLDAARRRNKALKAARSSSPPPRSEARWNLGWKLRDRGTIHHDVWTGPADELARQDAIRVAPKGGWWRGSPDYAEVSVRYSLIVSIRTPESEQDIYQEALAQIPIVQSTPIRELAPYVIQPVTVRI